MIPLVYTSAMPDTQSKLTDAQREQAKPILGQVR